MSKAIKVVNKSVGQVGGLVKNNALSVFSGAGGMDIGFTEAGTNVVAAVEKWKPAAETFRRNFPDVNLFEGDITNPELKAKVIGHLQGQAIDVIFGGPPCTGFSLLGTRNTKNPCNYLYRDVLELAGKIRPAIIALENVPGLLSMPLSNGLLAIEAITQDAAKLGYKLEHKILCAADIGVAQLRERLIIILTRYDIPITFPEPTHGPEGSGLKPYATVRDVIGDLEHAPEDEAFSHVFTKHNEKLMARIKATKPGEALYARNHGCRLEPDKPAATLTNNNGSTVIHYKFDRMITPRECARIQGFPDIHLFSGSKNDVGKQVGNALPPALAKAVATSVVKMLNVIKAGAPEVTFPAPVVEMPTNKDVLDAEVANLRKGCIGKVNGEQDKINVSEGRVDSIFLRMGMFISKFITDAKALGETREDYLYKSLVKDKNCKVKKGALYNASSYYQLHRAISEKFGRAPDLGMTYFVKVRHKALTIDEQHDLLRKAELDHGITVSKLTSLVAEKLSGKGMGRKEPEPDAEMASYCNKALTSVTKVAGLLKKGMVPSKDTVLLLGKISVMLAKCSGHASAQSPQPIHVHAEFADACKIRRAS